MAQIDKAWEIPQPDNANIATMLSYPPGYYQKRLQKIGFMGKDKTLLDAGCGAGHWTIAASNLNKKVYGIDLTEKYLHYAQEIKKNLVKNNIELKRGSIEKLPYKDKTFDFIICYSVWMFTDKEKVLKEFRRVLKPSGKLYLGSLIGPSWYPKLILKGLSKGKQPLIIESLRAMFSGIVLTEKKARELLERNGFKIMELSSDGDIGNKNIKIKPIYDAKRWGMWEVFEILAEMSKL